MKLKSNWPFYSVIYSDWICKPITIRLQWSMETLCAQIEESCSSSDDQKGEAELRQSQNQEEEVRPQLLNEIFNSTEIHTNTSNMK